MKYELKNIGKSWWVEGMVVEGKPRKENGILEIDAVDICELNKDIMSKEQIIECMKCPRYDWGRDYLECIEPKTIWDIERRDLYWWYNPLQNKVIIDYWDDLAVDHTRRNSGLAFITEKEAYAEKRYNTIKRDLLKMGGRLNFKPGEDNWIMQYDSINDGIYNVSFIEHFSQDVFFDTSEELTYAIKEIGGENIIKYWFRVEKD